MTRGEIDVFAGSSEMARLGRATDWSLTPLGGVERWPATLRAAVRLMLGTPVAASLWCGPSYTLIYNDAYRRILAAKHPWALGRSGVTVWSELWPALEPEFERVRTRGESVFAEEALLTMARLEGGQSEDAWFTYALSPLTDEDGRCLAVYNVAIEITARVKSEAARSDRERQLRIIADAIPTLAWTARPDGYIDWYNARWYEYTGKTPDQMEGWGWQEVHDPAVLPVVMARWASSIATGQPFEMTFPLLGADGRFRPFLTRVSPLVDDAGRVVRWFGTNTDVEAEHAALQAAERANRAKTEFLATMSHELRTPLNAIAGYADLIELGIHGPTTEAQRDAIHRIQRSQRHLLGLINDVLNYAKLEAGRVEYRLEDVPIDEAVSAVEPLVTPLIAAKRQRFTREECTHGCIVRADAEKLRQILINLVSNAMKFTPEGGSIELRCATRGDEVRVTVQDNGIGIPADRVEHVFEPFVQVGRQFNTPQEGTGLGLAISRDLARAMSGDLTVESTFGEGSTFTLLMPRSPGD